LRKFSGNIESEVIFQDNDILIENKFLSGSFIDTNGVYNIRPTTVAEQPLTSVTVTLRNKIRFVMGRKNKLVAPLIATDLLLSPIDCLIKAVLCQACSDQGEIDW
jgi:hypothetical protein